MSRIGCRTLLKRVVNFSPVILVNKTLYHHPTVRKYLCKSIVNVITIANKTFTSILSKDKVIVLLTENKHSLRLVLPRNLQVQGTLRFDEMLIYISPDCYTSDKGWGPLRKALIQMLSTDIFGICIPMFELFKANTN